MYADKTDTIAAVCTGAGGAISIVRISGPEALSAVSSIWHGNVRLSSENARTMFLGKAKPHKTDAQTEPDTPGEPCLAVYMPGPNSYTGEDVAELHCHGGAFAPKRILDAVLSAGARLAEPGEFTRRAFINGKMDLTQAEAVADLIAAKSEAACRLAERQLSGRLGNTVKSCREPLLHALAEIESRLDFPEEELDWKPVGELCTVIDDSLAGIRKLLSSSSSGVIIRDGIRVVIAGRPNVGKSSLLNMLLGYDRAIVTHIPGTTRDTVEEYASIRGIPVRLTDTAGIRHDTGGDIVENLGIQRSLDSIQTAEIVLWLLDGSSAENARESLEHMQSHKPDTSDCIIVWNKTDLNGNPNALPSTDTESVKISIAKNTGIESLLDLFEKRAWGSSEHAENDCAVAARHAGLLGSAAEDLSQASIELGEESWELAASCLRSAIASLGRITGEDTNPDMLDEIFSRFCIGK